MTDAELVALLLTEACWRAESERRINDTASWPFSAFDKWQAAKEALDVAVQTRLVAEGTS